MDPGAVGGDIPDGCGHGAKNHLRPDAGDDGGQALAAVGIHPGFGDVGKKCRREINKMEAHAMHMPAVVLAGETVGRFVEEEHEAGEQPELDDVVKAFFGKVVKLQGVAADLVPASEENVAHQRKRGDES